MERSVILIVDDEEANRKMYREALELEGYEVIEAAGGREAIDILKTREVDAIVCDIQMPHNGIRVFEYLTENFPHLRERFIFMSGNIEKKREAEKKARAAVFLQKPFSLEHLRRTMRLVLGTSVP